MDRREAPRRMGHAARRVPRSGSGPPHAVEPVPVSASPNARPDGACRLFLPACRRARCGQALRAPPLRSGRFAVTSAARAGRAEARRLRGNTTAPDSPGEQEGRGGKLRGRSSSCARPPIPLVGRGTVIPPEPSCHARTAARRGAHRVAAAAKRRRAKPLRGPSTAVGWARDTAGGAAHYPSSPTPADPRPPRHPPAGHGGRGEAPAGPAPDSSAARRAAAASRAAGGRIPRARAPRPPPWRAPKL